MNDTKDPEEPQEAMDHELAQKISNLKLDNQAQSERTDAPIEESSRPMKKDFPTYSQLQNRYKNNSPKQNQKKEKEYQKLKIEKEVLQSENKRIVH